MRLASRPAGLRSRLMAGAAAVGLGLGGWAATSGHALAQSAPAPLSPAPTAPPATDGLEPGAVFVDADSVGVEGDVLTLTGEQRRAYARFRDNSLRARMLRFDTTTGVGEASGEVELTGPAGDTVFASRLTLDEDLRAGVATDFASRLANGASLMAATAVRLGPNVNQLNYAVFTPCPICDAEGRPKTPSISIQAERVVQDEALRAILYRNAVIRVGGVPVLWLPAFAHPDPTVERASGFLVPTANYDEGRGLSVEIPYLLVVSPSEDWLVSPQINGEIAPLLNLQWRRRFETAYIEARGGYTYERNFGDFDLDGDGRAESNVRFGEREHRSYLLSHGWWDPDGPWRAGFTAERTSDKTLFDRYDVRDPYRDNGLYYGDRRRLINQVYAERQTARSYLSAAAFTLQSLRVVSFDPVTPALNVFEDDDDLPVVAPLIDARWEPAGPVLGGRLRLRGSAVALYRSDYVGQPVLRPGLVGAGIAPIADGVDSRRVTGIVDWRRTLISPAGVRWEPFVDARLDAYSIADLPPVLGGGDSADLTRGRVTGGLDVAYPLVRRMAPGVDLVVEPMAQMSLSNRVDQDPRIPNEDAQTIELDQADLFRTDRFPGLDLVEGGLRFTAGTRATLSWNGGRHASLFVGRSFRDREIEAFRAVVPDDPSRLYDPTGLAPQSSDWVVQGTFAPSDRIRAWGHATVDAGGQVRRAETALDGRWGRRNLASISYIVDRSNPLDGPLNRNYEFVQLAGQQFVYGNWGVAVSGIADLERDVITRSEAGLVFDDDCLRIEFGYRRDNTRVRPSGPSDGVYVRLNLATFGGSSYGQPTARRP